MNRVLKSSTFRAAVFGIILLLLQIFGGLILGIVNETFNLNLNAASALVFAQVGLLFIPCVLYFLITKEPIRETLRLNPINISNIFMIILITIFIQPLIMSISAIGNLFFPNYLLEATTEINKDVSLPIMIVLTALFPAMFEEFSMRGIVLSGFRNKSLRFAAFINGLLFAVLHMNLQQGLYAFVLGYIFVYLVDATNSIFASMIPHFLINASNMMMLRFAAESLSKEGQTITSVQQAASRDSLIITIIFLSALALVFTFLAYLVYKRLKRNNTPPAFPQDNNVGLM